MNETQPTGNKFDGAKPRTDLLPTLPLLRIAEVLGHGAEKYDAHNWRAGIDYSRIYGATLRHLFAWNDGEDMDKDSGMHHLAHAACEILFLLEYVNKAEYMPNDDRYSTTPYMIDEEAERENIETAQLSGSNMFNSKINEKTN